MYHEVSSGLCLPTFYPKNTKQSSQVKALVSSPSRGVKTKKVKKTNGHGQSEAVSAYFAGLHDPFSRAARGVRYLDPVSYPTTTAVSEGVLNVTSDASGYASLAIFADPFCSVIVDTGTIVSSSASNWASNPWVWQVATTAQLGGVFSTYRVVSSGIQIRNLQQPVSTQGRIYAAKTTGTGWIPSYVMLSQAGTKNNLMELTMNTSSIDSRILTLPESTETTLQDLIQNHMPIASRPTSADCTSFKSPGNISLWNASAGVGEPIFAGTTVVATSVTSAQKNGRDVILLDFSGCPPSTLVAEIKYVLHYEGTPALTSSSGVVTPDAMGTGAYMPRTAAAIEQSAAQKATSSDWIDDAFQTAKTIVSGTAKAIAYASEIGELIAPLLV